MYQFVLFIHVFAAVCLIALVLVQQGKGATMGAAFGSGASQTVFGSRGSGSFLFRVTIALVAVFFVTSLALNYISMSAYKQQKPLALPVVPLQHEAAHPASAPLAPLTPAAAPSVEEKTKTKANQPSSKNKSAHPAADQHKKAAKPSAARSRNSQADKNQPALETAAHSSLPNGIPERN